MNGYSNASECVGKGYYALDGNTVANKPSNTNGFVMQVYKSGDNSLLQMVYSFSGKKWYSRTYNGSSWGSWTIVNNVDLSPYAKKTDLTKFQTESQVEAKISALVGSAPGTLDTLNELAAALGDDPNFATTVTNKIGEKVDKTTYASDKATFALKSEIPTTMAWTSITGKPTFAKVATSGSYNDLTNKPTPYSLPTASNTVKGGITLGYDENGRNYPLELDDDGKAYVNVPWTDSNTTYGNATQSASGLMSSSDKKKLDGIADGANKTIVDSTLSSSSTNPVQNKVVKAALDGKANSSHTHSISQVTNLQSSLDGKSNVGHTHAISGLTDLNSGWDTLLQNAPSAYVTSWPTISNVRDKQPLKLQLNGGTTEGTNQCTYSGTTAKTVNITPSSIGAASSSHSHNAATTTSAGFLNKLDGNTSHYLRGDGSWATPPNTTYGVATTSGNGLMSSSDKAKLDGIASGANKTVVDATLSSSSTNPVQNKVVKAALDGKANSSHTHSTATTSSAGFLRQLNGSTSQYLRGDGSWATPPNTTYSTATEDSDGLVRIGYEESGKNYPVELDSSHRMFVNVPWTDTNTTYGNATQSASGLMSSSDKKKLDGIASGANKTIVDSTLSSSSTNPVQNKVIKTALDGKANSSHTHSISQITNLQSSLDGKSNVGHTHTISGLTDLNSGWDSLLQNAPSAYVTSWPTISNVRDKQALKIQLNGGTTEGTNQFTYSGTTAKSVNITPSSIGAASSSHSHNAATTTSAGFLNKLDGSTSHYLRGDGSWATPPNTTYGVATTSSNGLMSSSDKAKLDGIASGANKTVVDSGITSGGTNPVQGKAIYTALAGKANSSHTHSISQVTNLQSSLDSKSNTGHTHAISGLTDLNSGWDSLLKSTPSTYVTRWPSWSEVSGKPSTFTPSTHTHSYLPLSGGTLNGDLTLSEGIVSAQGYKISGKTTSDLLNGAGTTTSISTIQTQVMAGIVDGAPTTLDTLNELAAALGDDPNFATTISNKLGNKVDKVSGKELSSNDFTDTYKSKLDGIAAGANKTVVDSSLSSSSTNPVQNKVIKSALDGKANSSHTHGASQVTGLSKVATSGSYNDLSNKPTIPSAYTLPTASSTQKGGITLGFTETNKNYPLELDENGKAFVNVPWTDTNTTYNVATQSSNGLMSSSDKKKLDGIASGANKTTVDSGITSGGTNPVQGKAIYTALAGKANSSHTHSISQVTNLQSTLDGKANTSHTHAISGLTDLNSGWDTYLKSAPSAYVTRWPSWSEVSGKPSTFTPSTHTHNYLPLSGGTMSGKLTYTEMVSTYGSGNRRTAMTSGGFKLMAASNSGWAGGLSTYKSDGEESFNQTIGGAYGDADELGYLFYGGTYDDPAMTILPNGNIGVGTTSPTTNFHVSGNAKVSGSVTATTFVGALSGNASSATKATQDGSGRTITSTYSTTSHTHNTATTSSAGFLRQLNGSKSQYLRGDGTWATPTNTTYSTATATSDGLVRIGYPESGKNYPVELDSSHRMFVNVPWTNTTYGEASASADGLMSKENYIKLTDISNNMFLMEQMGLLEHGGDGYLESISTVTQSPTGITMNFTRKHLTSTGAVEEGFQNVILPIASRAKAGLLSAADKTSLDRLSSGGAYLPLSGGTLTGMVTWNKGSGNKCGITPGVIQVLNQTSTDYVALTPQTIQIYDNGNQLVDISTGNAVFNKSIQVTNGYNNMTSGIDISTTSGIVIHNSSHGVRFASGGSPNRVWTTNGGNASLITVDDVTRVLAGGLSGSSMYSMETNETSGTPSISIMGSRTYVNEASLLSQKSSIFTLNGGANVVGAQLVSWVKSDLTPSSAIILGQWVLHVKSSSTVDGPMTAYVGDSSKTIPINTYVGATGKDGTFQICIPMDRTTGKYAGSSKIVING